MHSQDILYCALNLGLLAGLAVATPYNKLASANSQPFKKNAEPPHFRDRDPHLITKREDRDPATDPYPNLDQCRAACQTPPVDKAVFYSRLGDVIDGRIKFDAYVHANSLAKVGSVYSLPGYLDQSPSDPYFLWYQDWADRFSGVFAEKV